MMNGDLLFRRGYLIREGDLNSGNPSVVSSWNTRQLDNYVMYIHPDLPETISRDESYNLALLGTVIDPITGIAEPDTILTSINSHLTNSDESFFDYLDNLSGRFILFVEGEEQAFALQDAAGTKSLYYNAQSQETILASNPGLIAELGNYNRSTIADEVMNADVSYFPGISTYYSKINQLTPNTLIRLPDGDIERFYPRQPLTPKQLSDELVTEVADILITQMKLINENHDLVLSLSAGLDSRVSLAATRPIAGDIEYCSWVSPNRDNREAEAAKELCKNLGVNHRIIDLSNEAPEYFRQIFETHTSRMSDPDRADGTFNFYTEFSDEKLELRSNIAEVGRTFYRNEIMNPPGTIHPENFSKLYFRVNSSEIDQTFREFFNVTSFKKENIYNYDPYDLFYWEHRMGNWLSQWMMDRDLSHDHFVVYNNRRLLEKMLSVDIEHRVNDELFYRVIEEIWPECLSTPINPHKNKSGNDQLKRFTKGILFRVPSPIYNRAINAYRTLL